MRTEKVEFYSEGLLVRALWQLPDTPPGPVPAIVQGPGWFGLKDAAAYAQYHQAFTDAGFGVLSIDYRGFGDSDGERGLVAPAMQLEDLVNAVTYLTTRTDVDTDAIGAFGTGGTGGGNVVLLGDADPRVRALVSQFPVADGRDWLRSMRREHEWHTYLAEIEADRRERVRTGTSRMVHPREQIMVQTPERQARKFKAEVDQRNPTQVPLSTAERVMAYRPLDAAARLTTPLLVVTVDRDATTPTDHAVWLYEAARGPKRLLLQRDTEHYEAYTKYADVVLPEMVAWFRTHLRDRGPVVVRSAPGDPDPRPRDL